MGDRKYIAGIDPGARGAIAIINPERTWVELIRFEKHSLREIADIIAYSAMEYPLIVTLEKVGSRPHDGTRSTHSFGVNYGVIQGVLFALDIPFHNPVPQTWQRAMAMGGKIERRKAASAAKVKRLWPKLKGVTQETADAVLLAEYGWLLEYQKKTP